jgi:hypothetical protein
MELFHVSEEAGISEFIPRAPASANVGVNEPVVWAVDDAHLHNYLLPRECPRVAIYALPESDPFDVAWLIGPSGARYVVAIESAWFLRARDQRLFVYTLPPDPFVAADPGAGYWISRVAVRPAGVWELVDPLAEMLARGVELRVMLSLWSLHDAVAESTLQFSMIRMRNAQPRPEERP